MRGRAKRAYNINMVKRHDTPLIFILKSLIPYTRPNLLLSFRPNQFFNEIAQHSDHSRKSLRDAYNYAKRKGLVIEADRPSLTFAGQERVQPFVAKKLHHGGKLMVIFDIPEEIKLKRDAFRRFLRKLEFAQVQQSVWLSENDNRAIVREAIDFYGLSGMVEVYEAARLD